MKSEVFTRNTKRILIKCQQYASSRQALFSARARGHMIMIKMGGGLAQRGQHTRSGEVGWFDPRGMWGGGGLQQYTHTRSGTKLAWARLQGRGGGGGQQLLPPPPGT